ncbi:hypothetical protein [Streptomyces carpaticus]|uniref:ATP-binding protein n=1 Tax=Streptomyces carpaticus TaxID=285558 RepID=A0ABV4ZRJ2_9ACTN
MQLGVSELLSNVLKHTLTPWCLLRLMRRDDVFLRVEVLDTSEHLPAVGAALGWEAESGRGLWMSQAMASGFGVVHSSPAMRVAQRGLVRNGLSITEMFVHN